MNVAIVGAGLAGPLLAQGLVRAGVDVALYEREAAIDERTQGYRIHLDPAGDLALRACLPPALYEQALATAGIRGSGVTILDPQLNVVRRIEVPPAEGDAVTSVDRVTLRRILLTGLDVHYGTAFERYELLADGRVRTHFTSGEVADADLLVAADGTHSRIRKQLLPTAEVVETGQLLIFGKTPLPEARALAPAAAFEGFSAVAGTDGRFMPLAAHRPRTGAGDYLMWVVGIPRAQPVEDLLTTAADAIADWHPNLRQLVQHSDPLSVSSTMIRTAKPVPHWQTVPVTLIGDAIHTMVPAGIGAAVALRDAALLCRRVTERTGALLDAVSEYEKEMLDYGFAAVEQSLRSGV